MHDNFGETLKAHYTEFIEQLPNNNVAGFEEYKIVLLKNNRRFEGLTDVEIEDLRAAQSVSRLPAIYIQVLQTMGRSSSGIFMGTENIYGQLKLRKQDLQTSLSYKRAQGMPTPDLPENAFVFSSIKGIYFWYFIVDEDDPPVYYYYAGSSKFEQKSDLLSEWYFTQGIYGSYLVKLYRSNL